MCLVSSALAVLLPVAAFAAPSSSSSSSSPAPAADSSWQRLYDALNAWQTDLSTQQKETDLQQAEQLFQTNADLFPDLSKLGIESSVLDAAREQRTAAYVTALIGGTQIVFSDSSADQWYAPYVRNVAELGILTGYRDAAGNLTGKFGPDDPVTIEQVAKSVLNATGVSVSTCPQTPLNVTSSGSWSAPYVACAEKAQWSVYSDGSVDAHRPATRAEVIATVLQAFKIQTASASGTIFTDVPATMQFANYIEKAAKDGIISGYTTADGNLTGLFGPNDSINRAAFSKMLSLALQVYKK